MGSDAGLIADELRDALKFRFMPAQAVCQAVKLFYAFSATTREDKMSYKILKEAGLDKLEKKVNEAIADGWEPMGGVASVLAMPGTPIYMQALIKRK
jgi:hypothetical protein